MVIDIYLNIDIKHIEESVSERGNPILLEDYTGIDCNYEEWMQVVLF